MKAYIETEIIDAPTEPGTYLLVFKDGFIFPGKFPKEKWNLSSWEKMGVTHWLQERDTAQLCLDFYEWMQKNYFKHTNGYARHGASVVARGRSKDELLEEFIESQKSIL